MPEDTPPEEAAQPDAPAEAKAFKAESGKEFKVELKIERKEIKPEKLEKELQKDVKDKEIKNELKIEWKEHKGEKEHKEKPEKEAKEYKAESGKEFKNELKIEWKETKPEIKEHVAEKPPKIEIEEGKGVQEITDAVVEQPAIPTSAAVVAAVERLHSAVQELRHFIGTELRPDLSKGALSEEADAGGTSGTSRGASGASRGTSGTNRGGSAGGRARRGGAGRGGSGGGS